MRVLGALEHGVLRTLALGDHAHLAPVPSQQFTLATAFIAFIAFIAFMAFMAFIAFI